MQSLCNGEYSNNTWFLQNSSQFLFPFRLLTASYDIRFHTFPKSVRKEKTEHP